MTMNQFIQPITAIQRTRFHPFAQIPLSNRLTGAQIDLLEVCLNSIENAMTIEKVDGFFCALISSHDLILPKEYLPCIFGGKLPDLGSGAIANSVIEKLFQHWRHIGDTLQRGVIYYPIRFEDDGYQASEWADGYMIGVELRRKTWSRLLEDEKYSKLMVPVMAVHFERGGDACAKPCRMSKALQDDLLSHMITSILEIYRFFAPKPIIASARRC